MCKYQNQIDLLESIESVRSELPTHADSSLSQSEVMLRLSGLYACLNIADLKQMISDLKGLNLRVKEKLPRHKNVA